MPKYLSIVFGFNSNNSLVFDASTSVQKCLIIFLIFWVLSLLYGIIRREYTSYFLLGKSHHKSKKSQAQFTANSRTPLAKTKPLIYSTTHAKIRRASLHYCNELDSFGVKTPQNPPRNGHEVTDNNANLRKGSVVLRPLSTPPKGKGSAPPCQSPRRRKQHRRQNMSNY